MLSLVAAAPLAAQEGPADGGNAAAAPDANAAAPDANAAARAANDRLRGVSKEDSLLGGPSMSRDPYRSALDAEGTRQSNLMGTEREPNNATNRNGYDSPTAPPTRAPKARAPAANAAADAALHPEGQDGQDNNAARGGGKARANTAEQAAQKLYGDPFKGKDGAAQQVYHTPW